MKGDGNELCCLVNYIRKCRYCGVGLCSEHWWDCCRTSQDLDIVPGHGNKCIRCGRITPYVSNGDYGWPIKHSEKCEYKDVII
jgi:hypothetical protein